MMIATFVLAMCHIVKAEDKVTISDFIISAGETKEVTILLTNDITYVAFQFDLYLPQGITVTEYNADPTRVPKSTDLSMSQQSDGSYRFISAAMGRLPLVGNSGGIVLLKVTASKNLDNGEMTGYFRKVKLSKSDAKGATYTEMSFPITVSGPSVVTAKSVSREYGDANPQFEYSVAGGALNGTPVISCQATATSMPGEYPITIVRGSVTNKDVTFVDGTLTITKAPLTITAKSYTIKQGEPLPKYEITYFGFKNGETKSVLTKQPTISCSATSTNEPGTYTITVSGATANNYEITHVKGTLRILDPSAPTLLGDINYDGEVDVTDVVELIDMVLAGSNDPVGDINGDGEVDVTDVVELIDIVLGN